MAALNQKSRRNVPSFGGGRVRHSTAALYGTRQSNTIDAMSADNSTLGTKASSLSVDTSNSSREAEDSPIQPYTRNYYCELCPFRTKKSAEFLYHQVGIHKQDFNIFSCDNCDYASRWGCKVLRHRRKLHGLENGDFEPHVHSLQYRTTATTAEGIHTEHDDKDKPAKHALAATAEPDVAAAGLASARAASTAAKGTPGCTTDELPGSSRRKPAIVHRIPMLAASGALLDGDVGDTSLDSSCSDDSAYAEKQPSAAMAHQKSERTVMDELATGPMPADRVGNDSASVQKVVGTASSSKAVKGTRTPAASTSSSVSAKPLAAKAAKSLHVTQVIVNGVTMFHCMRCSYMSPLRWKTAKHYRIRHMANRQYTCPFCPLVTMNRIEFFRHKMLHSAKEVFNCPECDYVSSSRTNLERHVTKHQLGLPLKCSLCSFSSTGVASVQRHMAEHHHSEDARKLFAAQLRSGDNESSTVTPGTSGKQTATSLSDASIADDTPGSTGAGFRKGTATPMAGRTSAGRGTNITGRSIEIACGTCGHETDSIRDMKVHMVEAHGRTSLGGGGPLRCSSSTADSDFGPRLQAVGKGSMKRKYRLLHPGAADATAATGATADRSDGIVEGSPKRSRLSDVKGTADGAGGRDSSALSAAQHEGSPSSPVQDDEAASLVGTAEEPSELRCSQCTYIAKWPSDFKRHEKVHTLGSRFYCSLCTRNYKYSGDLNVHMRRSHRSEMRAGNPDASSNPATRSSDSADQHAPSTAPHGRGQGQSVVQQPLEGLNDGGAANLVASQSPGFVPPLAPSTCRKVGGKGMTEPEESAQGAADAAGQATDGAAAPLAGAPAKQPGRRKLPSGASSFYRCPSCSYSTPFKSRLDTHMRTHSTRKPFRCTFCGYSSYWRGDTKKHMERHHPFLLAGCNDAYKLIEQTFQEDLRNAEQSRLQVAGYRSKCGTARGSKKLHHVFVKKGTARRMKVTPMRPKPAAVPSPAPVAPEGGSEPQASSRALRPYKCEACGLRYIRVCDVKKHVHLAHSSMPDVSIVLLTREELLQLGESEADLAMHYPSTQGASDVADGNHSDPGDLARPFGCSVCGKRSRWKSNLTKHLLLHPDAADARVIVHSAEFNRQQTQLAGARSMTVAATDHQQRYHSMSDNGVQPHVPTGVPGASTKKKKKTDPTGRYQCSVCSMCSEFSWVVGRHLRVVHKNLVGGRIVELRPSSSSQGARDAPGNQQASPSAASAPVPIASARAPIASLPSPIASPPAPEVSTPAPEASPPAPGASSASEGSPARAASALATDSGVVGIAPWNVASFKCKYCGFATKWRSAIHRHIRCKHPSKSALGVIVVDNPQARQCMTASSSTSSIPIQSGSATAPGSCKDVNAGQDVTAAGDQSARHLDNWATERMKWHCARCAYDHDDRQNVLAHLHGRHHQNAYQCSLCQFFADTEEDIENHVRSKHTSHSNDILTGRRWVHNMAYAPAGSIKESCQKNQEKARRNFEDRKVDGIYYCCIFCDMKTSWRSAVLRHLKERHSRDSAKMGQSLDNLYRRVEDAARVRADVNDPALDAGVDAALDAGVDPALDAGKRLHCPKCGFCTRKLGLYKKHMQRHQPRPGSDVKCDRCDYWVSAHHFLDQHVRLHHNTVIVDVSAPNRSKEHPTKVTEEPVASGDHGSVYSQRGAAGSSPGDASGQQSHSAHTSPSRSTHARNNSSGRQAPTITEEHGGSMASDVSKKVLLPPVQRRQQQQHTAGRIASSDSLLQLSDGQAKVVQKFKIKPTGAASAKRRFPCPVCPYRCKSATDLLYHKQFHRPKATATFKCPKCKYWVSRNGLLKQHVKVHDPDYLSAASLHAALDVEAAPRGPVSGDKASSGGGSYAEESSSMHDGTVDMAQLKQRLLSSRIQPVVLLLPVAPELLSKLDSDETVSPAYGRKVYRCSHCPYAAPLPSLLEKHERNHERKMRALRAALDASRAGAADVPSSSATEFECMLCSYSCDDGKSLEEHLFVHSMEYTGCLDEVITSDHVKEMKELAAQASEGAELVSSEGGFNLKYNRVSGEYVLEPSTDGVMQYQCEKCPYTASRKEHFQRHTSMHNGHQRYVCRYCDYSVPVFNLLSRHEQLHLSPNPNLVMCQKPGNMSLLPFIPADQALMDAVLDGAADDSDFYENRPVNSVAPLEDVGASKKKLYRCEWCPFANARKDHLISHLKFHNVRSAFKCHYCDYSVSKASLLKQHVRLHFMPFVGDDGAVKPLVLDSDDDDHGGDCVRIVEASAMEPEFVDISEVQSKISTNTQGDAGVSSNSATDLGSSTAKELICQYCERRFQSADDHHNHELQHLIGLVDFDDESSDDDGNC